MSAIDPPRLRWTATVVQRLRWAACALLVLEVVGLAMAGQANFSVGGDNPPWVGHRWHPIVVGGSIALGLTVTAVVTSARRRRWAGTTLILLLASTIALDVASIAWHERAFGTRQYFERAFSRLQPGSDASPVGETYVAGPGGYRTPDDPRGTRSWQIAASVPAGCASAARAAAAWSTDGAVHLYDDRPKSTGGLGCHFDVTYDRFDVTFQDVAEGGAGTWTLEAFMEPL